jgi:ribosomal protein S18 acetylase RimI-like enzyme
MYRLRAPDKLNFCKSRKEGFALDVTIRAHLPADRPFLREMLEAAAVPTYPELKELGRLSLRDRLDEIFETHFSADTKRIWVAVAPEGRLAGMIWVQPSAHPVTEKPDWLIINIAVAEPYQRRGIARRLMDHAKSECRAAGGRRMRLFVAAENTSATALYTDLGFTEQTREMLWKI